MTIAVDTPDADRLGEVVGALRDWQRESSPTQLHPGDIGWFWRHGPQATATALRTWSRRGHLLAVGLLDGPTVLRVTVAPEAWRSDELARRVVADLSDPGRGVLPPGSTSVEAPDGTRLRDVLAESGWKTGEPWSPLRRDLTPPVVASGLRVDVVTAGRSSAFTAVHRSVWGNPAFTDAVWQVMADGLPFVDAQCLLGFDDHGVAVAGATVWSAGRGKPGLLEPVGVHADHRGHGYGRMISEAAAAALRDLGSSSAEVCTPSANTAAVAAYASAGFRRLPERLDMTRDV